jgi:nucleotidyltransferase/DNA polymerase involved in DNA repair
MRIAAIYLPQFYLQAQLRIDPALVGRAVAIVGADRGVPTVLGCSRAAHGLGVRVGMPATVARALSEEIELVVASRALAEEAVKAVAETLLGLSPLVDRGGEVSGSHHTLYAEVPARCRGAAFGQRIAQALGDLDVHARIGIADDRFTAWVAASQVDADTVTSVPRGGSAAFLAPRPLALLGIPREVQHLLSSLGIDSLGAFAALPPPSTSHVWDADYQRLAQGQGSDRLQPYVPSGEVDEAIVCGAMDLTTACRRIAGRLAARQVGTTQDLELTVEINAPESTHRVALAATPGDAGQWLQRLISATSAVPLVNALRVVGKRQETAVAMPAAAQPLELSMPTELRASIGEYRRTRRGKQRFRPSLSAQIRLFSD